MATAICLAAGGTASAESGEIRKILMRADAAAKAVSAVTYEGEYYTEGLPEPARMHVRGRVSARQGWRSELGQLLGGNRERVRVEGSYRRHEESTEVPFVVVSDGHRVRCILPEQKLCTTGRMPDAASLMHPGSRLLMTEFLLARPFSDELMAIETTYEGKRKVGDVDCHVIYVVYQNRSESRWYFGVKDYLPRRVDRIVQSGEKETETVLIVRKLKVVVDLPAETFRAACPEGFKKAPFRELLDVGTQAPDWNLRTIDGETVSLRSLKGKVVVLGFWATWAPGCQSAMPVWQKFHDKYRDDPVVIYGVNCWESGDPVKYIEKCGFKFGILIQNPKDVRDLTELYCIRGIPSTYVIDGDGRIVYAESAYKSGFERSLSQAIDQALTESASVDGD